MARLSYKGQVVEVNDNDRLLLDYYQGDGATVIDEQAQPVEEPAESPEPVDAAVVPQQDATADPAAGVDAPEPAQGDSAPHPGPAADPAGA